MSAASDFRNLVIDAQEEFRRAQDSYRARPTKHGRELVEAARANLRDLMQPPAIEPEAHAEAVDGAEHDASLLALVRRWFGGAYAFH